MKISIITVCYNSARTIKDTIESVISQSYNNIEYIIIDGGSNDATTTIINEYIKHVDIFISEHDHGIYDAMNKGIKLATGDIIGILNSDDVYQHCDVIDSIVRKFETDNVDIVYGNLVVVSSKDIRKVLRYYSLPNFVPSMFRYGWMPPHPATFIKKSIYDLNGYYNIQYKIAADYELLVRNLYRNGCKYSYFDEVAVRMRIGGVSSSNLKSIYMLNKEIISACIENGIYTNWLLLSVKIPFKVVEFLKRP